MTKKKQKTNLVLTIVLILGTLTVFFPLYMAVIIAFKKPSEWKFLIFTPNSYFVDIRHRAQKCSMIQVVHRWIIPIE